MPGLVVASDVLVVSGGAVVVGVLVGEVEVGGPSVASVAVEVGELGSMLVPASLERVESFGQAARSPASPTSKQ